MSAPATGAPPFRLRSVALSGYGPTIVSALGHGAVLPVLALRARDLGADVPTAALVVALLGVGQLLTSLPAGALVARIGERRSLALAGAVDALAMLAASVVGSVWALAGAVLVSGATWTVFMLARQGYMIDVVPAGSRARALSTLGGTHRVGLFVGPLVGSLVIATSGLEAVFWLAAAMSAAAGALALLLPGPPSLARAAAAAEQPGGRRPPRLRLRDVLREHRGVLASLGSAVVVIGAVRSLRTGVLPLWSEQVGLDAAETSLVFGVAGLVDALLFYPAGVVMDRWGRTWVAVPVVAAVAVGLLVLPLTTGFGGVLAVAVLMAVGNGMGAGVVMTLGADVAPEQGRAQFLGGFRLAGDVGSTGGPLLVSAVAALAPLAVACWVTGGLALLGTGWVARQVSRAERRRRLPPGAMAAR
ncbi:MFS transporter [Aquipuribacter hungaricus]|uniref:MFS transporter n=2 Tax=Aquipuribacter hungaricus TaxID=545624 RepID=UPI003610B2F7